MIRSISMCICAFDFSSISSFPYNPLPHFPVPWFSVADPIPIPMTKYGEQTTALPIIVHNDLSRDNHMTQHRLMAVSRSALPEAVWEGMSLAEMEGSLSSCGCLSHCRVGGDCLRINQEKKKKKRWRFLVVKNLGSVIALDPSPGFCPNQPSSFLILSI